MVIVSWPLFYTEISIPEGGSNRILWEYVDQNNIVDRVKYIYDKMFGYNTDGKKFIFSP